MGFAEKVYSLTRKVPKGKVTTYKEIAVKLNTKAYRAVGTALNRNPHAPEVPCHRVVNSNWYVGGFAKGAKSKIILLKKEGIEIENNKIKSFKTHFHKFS